MSRIPPKITYFQQDYVDMDLSRNIRDALFYAVADRRLGFERDLGHDDNISAQAPSKTHHLPTRVTLSLSKANQDKTESSIEDGVENPPLETLRPTFEQQSEESIHAQSTLPERRRSSGTVAVAESTVMDDHCIGVRPLPYRISLNRPSLSLSQSLTNSTSSPSNLSPLPFPTVPPSPSSPPSSPSSPPDSPSTPSPRSLSLSTSTTTSDSTFPSDSPRASILPSTSCPPPPPPRRRPLPPPRSPSSCRRLTERALAYLSGTIPKSPLQDPVDPLVPRPRKKGPVVFSSTAQRELARTDAMLMRVESSRWSRDAADIVVTRSGLKTLFVEQRLKPKETLLSQVVSDCTKTQLSDVRQIVEGTRKIDERFASPDVVESNDISTCSSRDLWRCYRQPHSAIAIAAMKRRGASATSWGTTQHQQLQLQQQQQQQQKGQQSRRKDKGEKNSHYGRQSGPNRGDMNRSRDNNSNRIDSKEVGMNDKAMQGILGGSKEGAPNEARINHSTRNDITLHNITTSSFTSSSAPSTSTQRSEGGEKRRRLNVFTDKLPTWIPREPITLDGFENDLEERLLYPSAIDREVKARSGGDPSSPNGESHMATMVPSVRGFVHIVKQRELVVAERVMEARRKERQREHALKKGRDGSKEGGSEGQGKVGGKGKGSQESAQGEGSLKQREHEDVLLSGLMNPSQVIEGETSGEASSLSPSSMAMRLKKQVTIEPNFHRQLYFRLERKRQLTLQGDQEIVTRSEVRTSKRLKGDRLMEGRTKDGDWDGIESVEAEELEFEDESEPMKSIITEQGCGYLPDPITATMNIGKNTSTKANASTRISKSRLRLAHTNPRLLSPMFDPCVHQPNGLPHIPDVGLLTLTVPPLRQGEFSVYSPIQSHLDSSSERDKPEEVLSRNVLPSSLLPPSLPPPPPPASFSTQSESLLDQYGPVYLIKYSG